MHEIEEFTVKFAREDVAELKERLRKTRWPDQLRDSGWTYGAELTYVQKLAKYWESEYDWDKVERYLNSSFHNYKLTGVHDLERLHFLHERSPRADARPLLLLHGWPGSYYEFHRIIPMLLNPAPDQPAFHIVAPSLPGFGFSSAPTRPGFGLKAMAKVFDTLMTTLGYERYFSQGGDWGSMLSKSIAQQFPERCRAIHLNLNLCGPVWYNPFHLLQYANARYFPQWPLLVSANEMRCLRKVIEYLTFENGYFVEQSTKPQTLGYGLTDSPTGLLAWIVEKFELWSDNRGDIENSFTKDDLLTNVSLYWLSGNITSSFRIYYEATRTGDLKSVVNSYCEVPTGISAFAVDINAPEAWARSRCNLKRFRCLPSGGHFAALETPDILAHEIREYFRTCSL